MDSFHRNGEEKPRFTVVSRRGEKTENDKPFTPSVAAELSEELFYARAEKIASLIAGEEVAVFKESAEAFFARFEDGDPAPVCKWDDGLFASELYHGETLSADGIAKEFVRPIAEGRIPTCFPYAVCLFSAYCDLVAAGEIESGERVNFVFPAGDRDWASAILFAKETGLPVGKAFVAAATVPQAGWLETGFVDDDEAGDAIEDYFEEYGCVLDCSVAKSVVLREIFVQETGDRAATVVLLTESPYRNVRQTLAALGLKSSGDRTACAERLEEETALPIPPAFFTFEESKPKK